jgi:hypothetical protein
VASQFRPPKKACSHEVSGSTAGKTVARPVSGSSGTWTLGLTQHAGGHRPKRPVLLEVDQIPLLNDAISRG